MKQRINCLSRLCIESHGNGKRRNVAQIYKGQEDVESHDRSNVEGLRHIKNIIYI